CYRRAMSARPGDMDATFKYAETAWTKNPEGAVRALDDLLAAWEDDMERRAVILGFALPRKEWWGRIMRGEMPYHCAALDELFFTHAADDAKEFETLCGTLLAANPDSTKARRNLGNAKFVLGERHVAEALWQPAPAGTIWENLSFAPEFYDHLKAFTD